MGSAIAIFVPFPQVDQYQHIIKTFDFIAELEKKISGQQIVVIAERRILPRESRRGRNSKQPRPRSRTLTACLGSAFATNSMVRPSSKYTCGGTRLCRTA